MRGLGLEAPADRQKLHRVVRVIDACGRLQMTPAELERAAAAASTSADARDAVLFAVWPAANVAMWLEANCTPRSVCEKLLAANVTGEQLLHVCDLDLEQIGVAEVRDRAPLLFRAEEVRERHFAALRSFFGACSPPPPSRTVAPTTTDAATSMDNVPEPPPYFLCPITHRLMERLVLAPDGYNYEEVVLKLWLASRTASPTTGEPMASAPLLPNLSLHSAIASWKEQHHQW
eukprot:TRINITY_DN30_c0_g1_i17.p1 TRINITY_DN30_c0_g1~~TRINITY_DN30_c0_g1_i17.p1  ORF type:complete len:232 (+),score=72.99 TRINITY_DN30_c0_g1_i17:613-1308(+)